MKRALVAVAVLALLAGCAPADSLAAQYESGSNKGYISGDGALTVIAEGDRESAVEFASETTEGTAVSSDDYAGQVLVINFWYAACPPCRLEAPDLEAVYAEFADKGATFLGVNVRDQAAQAETFAAENGITYPSVVDTDNGNMLFAFAGTVAPNAVPTTLVIDKKGRVAARFLGLIDEPSTLKAIITDLLAEND